MSKHTLKLALTSLVLVGGCSQILGISDYEIDTKLGQEPDPGLGGGDNEGGGDGESGSGGTKGGTDNRGGEAHGMAGEPQGQGGTPQGQAGMVGMAGEDQGQAGMPPVGELVPCDSADCCEEEGGTAVGAELLSDPGFDSAVSGWTETSTHDEAIIVPGDPADFPAVDGDYIAWLAGLTDEISDVTSDFFVVPADAGWMELTGYRWFEVDSFAVANTDFAGIGLYDPNDINPVELPFFWNTVNGATSAGDTTDWTPFDASWSALPHAGETRYLMIRGKADAYPTASSKSNYVFDAVSLKVYRCYK